VILGTFVVLWGLQRFGFDFGLLFPPCGLKMRTGWPCPTCGMTTAVLAFARGEVLSAFYIQPAAGLLCTLLVAIAFFSMLMGGAGVYFTFLDRLFAEIRGWQVLAVLAAVLLAGWVVTLARAWAAGAAGF
jgi:hypothetical protein